jgi:hypothetical protein
LNYLWTPYHSMCERKVFYLCESVSVSVDLHAVCIPCHVMHMCSFSPVYESPHFLSSLLVTNLFPQSWHRCGFSPMCIMLWTLRLPAWLQPMPHTAHTHTAYYHITDKWTWLVRHCTRHCVHMKSVDTRFSRISYQSGLTKTMFPVTGWRVFLIILQKSKKIHQSCYKLINNENWFQTLQLSGKISKITTVNRLYTEPIVLYLLSLHSFWLVQHQLAIFTVCIYL